MAGTIITASSGSPLACNWNIFHTKPLEWIPQSVERGLENHEALLFLHISTALFTEALGFIRTSHALLTAARQIRELHAGDESWLFAEDREIVPLGYAPFVSWTESSHCAQGILVGAFRQLNHLVLHFASFDGIHTPVHYNFPGLGRFLGALQSLRSLDLILPY